MDRGVSSVQFDSAAWFAQLESSGADAQKRNDDAVRLLLATAPQTPPRPSEPLAMVRGSCSTWPTSSNERRSEEPNDGPTPFSQARRERAARRRCAPALARERRLGAAPAGADYRNLLVLIELKGGNDGLNTRRSVRRPDVLRIAPEARDRARLRSFSFRTAVGLHPALAPLLPLWKSTRARRAAGRRLSRSPTCRIFARSRSGTPRRAASSICRTAG